MSLTRRMWKSAVLLQVGLTIVFSLSDPAKLTRRDKTEVLGEYLQICKQYPLEIGIVIDSSSSIRSFDFKVCKKFLQDFLSQYNISTAPDGVRVSVISYAKGIYPEIGFNLTTYDSKEEIIDAIGQIPHKAGLYTNTGKAIEYMHQYQLAKGIVRPGVPKIGIVITDGNSQDWNLTKSTAEEARNDDINMFAIGVGLNIRDEELLNIAGDPDRVVRVDKYNELHSIKDILTNLICFVVRNQTTASHPDIDEINTTTSLPTDIVEHNITTPNPPDVVVQEKTTPTSLDIDEMNTTVSITTYIDKLKTTFSIPTYIVEQKITTPSSLNFACNALYPANIMFVFSPADLDPVGTSWATSLIVTTVDNAKGFRYGIISGSCPDDEGFHYYQYSNVDDIKQRVFEYGRLQVKKLIQILIGQWKTAVFIARDKVRKVAVIVTEGKSVGDLENEVASLSNIGVQVIISNTSEIELTVSDAIVLKGRTPELQAKNLASILCLRIK